MNTVWSLALAVVSIDDWSLHSIEDTGTLAIHMILADWPTLRGCSRPYIVRSERFHQQKTMCTAFSFKVKFTTGDNTLGGSYCKAGNFTG